MANFLIELPLLIPWEKLGQVICSGSITGQCLGQVEVERDAYGWNSSTENLFAIITPHPH